MPKPKWTESRLHVSRNSRLGIYGLVLLLLVLIAANALLPIWMQPDGQLDNEALEQAWADFSSEKIDSQALNAASEKQNISLFPFDPNTITKEELMRLGIPMKTVYTWLHYREKGGRFYKKNDLKKLFTLSESDYERLIPFVRLNTTASTPSTTTAKNTSYPYHYSQQVANPNLTIALNQADTTDLKKLPGIGSVFASRIIRYRKRLGGYYSVEQLKEVYGLPDSTYQKIAGHFTVNPAEVKKINLNRAFFKDLSHHPYLRPYAQDILKLRQQIGRFNSVEQLRQIDLINEQNYRKIAAYLSI